MEKTQFDVNHSLQFFRIKNQLDLSVASLKLASFGERAHDFASSACDRAAVLPALCAYVKTNAAKVKDEMRHQGDNKPSFFFFAKKRANCFPMMTVYYVKTTQDDEFF